MAVELRGSVGKRGRNRSEDAKKVQRLLNAVPPPKGPSPPLKEDGIATGANWKRTVSAIGTFQSKTFGWEDSRVDPNGKTLGKLNAVADKPSAGAASATLRASVGLGGANQGHDVVATQQLLNMVPRQAGGPQEPLSLEPAANGDAYLALVKAIIDFQYRQFGWLDERLSGRLEPGSKSLSRLVRYDTRQGGSAPPDTGGASRPPQHVPAAARSPDGRVQGLIRQAQEHADQLLGLGDVCDRNLLALDYILDRRRRSLIAMRDQLLTATEAYLFERWKVSRGGPVAKTGMDELLKVIPGLNDELSDMRAKRPPSTPFPLRERWATFGQEHGLVDYALLNWG